MGIGGGLEMMDPFSLQNENLMQSLTKGDGFTPLSLCFPSGCCVPLCLHTHGNVEQREARLFGGCHCAGTWGIPPTPFAFLL